MIFTRNNCIMSIISATFANKVNVIRENFSMF